MKKILLLGGSAQQLVAIQAAKDLGYYTIVCDYLPDNPGQYIADKFYGASTTDVEAVYDIATKEKIDGILAYASDPAALTAAIVAERLGLPTNPADSVEILGKKHLWRKFLRENGFVSPKSRSFSADTTISEIINDTAHLTFPIVIKPTDASGSKGVCVLEDHAGLETAIKRAASHSRNKILIAEEYIRRGFPSVIGGDIFVWEGKIVLYGEMECLRDDTGNPLIPIGKKPASLDDKLRNRIHDELQRLVTALDISFGEMNIEIILDRNDDIYFLELGSRAGGNMIPVQLSDAFGIDLVKSNIQAAMGKTPDIARCKARHLPGYYMTYVLHSYKSGRFKNITLDESISRFVYRQVIYKKKGDAVDVFDCAGKALGILFFHFDTIDEMEHFCKNHHSLVNIVLE